MSKNKKTLFKKVKLLVLDVDGVLTKGEIIYDDKGRELKIFNVRDGLGVFLLNIVGIKTVLLTAKGGEVVKKRAKDMRIAEVIGGVLPKEKMLGAITKKYKVREEDICFIGDDLIDIGIIKRVGVGVAVNDAAPAVKRSADYVAVNKGGQGAVREVVDLIIKARGLEKKMYSWLANPRLG